MICTAYAFLSPLRAPILFTLATPGSQKWKPGTLTYFQPLPFPVGEEEIAMGKTTETPDSA
jgi:hypothetical protein